jgi:hypothetical protein
MRLARSRAMVESRPVPFAAAGDGHGFVLDKGLVALGPFVRIEMARPPVISFAPDGSATGGAVRVMVDDKARIVRVDWLTGRVTIAGAS